MKSLIADFAHFSCAIVKYLFLERRLFLFFSNIVSLFVNRWLSLLSSLSLLLLSLLYLSQVHLLVSSSSCQSYCVSASVKLYFFHFCKFLL